ncbi:MAG: hypothetical protein C0424_10295 [Sphingobacteriaceae bacterium]|nr:hypothetical protein [Sphingobacteriaceae bacterium]
MSELKLYAFNQALALSPNTRIRLRRVNPMFADGRVQGTFSFPFQLPKKPNMQLLGFSHDPQITSPLTTITDGVRLEYAGESITGRLRLEDAGSFYECQFLADNGAAANAMQNKKLGELAFANEYQVLATAAGQQNRARNLARAVNENGWQSYPYVVFPFFNPNFFNKSEKAGGFYVANNFLDPFFEPSGLQRPLVKGDTTAPLLLVISSQVGQFIDGEIVSNGTLQGIVALHATKEANRLVVLEVTGGGWGATTITGQQSGATALVNTTSLAAPWPASHWHCPAVYVFSVFKGLASELGYEFISELVNDPEIVNLVLLTGKAINYELETVHGASNSPSYVALLPEGFFLRDVLPDMTVAELIEDFREFWGWVSYFDQQRQQFTVTSLRALLQRPPDADWTSFAERVYNKEVIDYGKAVAFTMSTDTDDELVLFKSILDKRQVSFPTPPEGGFRSGDVTQVTNTDWHVVEQNLSLIYVTRFWSHDLGEYKIGLGDPTIKTSRFAMAGMKQDVWFQLNRKTRMPYMGPIGSMRGFNLSEGNRIARLLFYRGLVNADPELEDYSLPYASPDEFDAALQEAFAYSVKFSGNKGRFKVWLSDYVDFMRNTFLVKRRINLPPGELLSFDITRKKVIDGTHYFIKHIDITLPYRQPAEAEMYKY